MSRRRLAAAVFFSAVIVLVLGVIVYTERTNATQTISVWVVTHDVPAGSAYEAGDVQLIQLRAATDDFNYEVRGPSSFQARFARSLSVNDILRGDDLVAVTAQSEVALTVEDPPPLSGGDDVDIYAALANDQQVMVGHDVIVETVSGGSITVLVPAADEAAWVAVGSSNVALHIALTVVGAQLAPSPLTADAAIHHLCGAACATSPNGLAATP
jgi:hypothetical protein